MPGLVSTEFSSGATVLVFCNMQEPVSTPLPQWYPCSNTMGSGDALGSSLVADILAHGAMTSVLRKELLNESIESEIQLVLPTYSWLYPFSVMP